MRSASAILWLLFALIGSAPAGPLTVIGDSLSKEYQVTFPGLPAAGIEGLDPDHPAARNWIEILHATRNENYDLGRFRNSPVFDMWSDIRLLGHEYNWAVPGATARHIRNLLTGTNLDEITGDEDIAILLAFAPDWTQSVARLTTQLQTQSGGAVIFCGGNDLRFGNSDPAASSGGKPISYETIYLGDGTGAGDPAPLMNSIRTSIQAAAIFVRTANPTLPLAICAVPHVGSAPDVNAKWPYDPVRTGRITAALEGLNAELRTWTDSIGAAWVNTPYDLTKQLIGRSTWTLGGQVFQVAADPLGANATPAQHNAYLFAQDGFHPTTVLQGMLARGIHGAMSGVYPQTHGESPAFFLTELFAFAGLPPALEDGGFSDFLTAGGVPDTLRAPEDDPDFDGVPNLLEFALHGFLSGLPDALHLPVSAAASGAITLTWRPRDPSNAWYTVTCQISTDLQSWSPVPETQIVNNPDGTVTASVPIVAGTPAWLRLQVALSPLFQL